MRLAPAFDAYCCRVTQSPPRATRDKLPYSFSGVSADLDKAVLLAGGEQVLIQGGLQCRTGPLLNRPAVLRVSNQRIVVALHYAFQPDRLLIIPAGSLVSVRAGAKWVKLDYRTESGTGTLDLDLKAAGILRIQPIPMGAPLAVILGDWLTDHPPTGVSDIK